jgi:hypothetical protein
MEEVATGFTNYTVRSFKNSTLYIPMRGKRNARRAVIGSLQTKRPHKKYTLVWEDNIEIYLSYINWIGSSGSFVCSE